MKTKEEIEQLVYGCFGEKEWNNVSNNAKLSLIETYTQCQEDMADKKYTEADMLEAIIYGSSLTPSHVKLYAINYIKSLNKQD